MPISCDPLRQNLKRYVVDTFFDKFNNLSEDTWFLSIGRPTPWPGGATSTEDGEVPVGDDTEQNETEFWQNVISHKKITKDNVSLVVPKYDWISGKVYTPYRNNIDLYSDSEFVEFYVVVDEERVYKCIDNNYNAKSVIPPTHTDTVIRKLSDGYRWKFLYTIAESKRKFITSTTYNSLNEIERVGYIPIEYVDFLKLNDERILQWQTQQAATKGTIDYINLKSNYKPFLITTNTLRSVDATNSVSNDVAIGATSFTIASSLLFGQNDYYKDMILTIDGGNGQGQRRLISSFTLTGSGSATVVVDHPLTVGLSAANTTFSILPNIKILGDGEGLNPTLNPNINRADTTISFGSSLTGSSSNVLNQTYVDSFEMINTGKNYTYASIQVVKGLTFVGLSGGGDINDIAEIVVSPFNGHGSDAPSELGSAGLMIVTDFDQSERGALTVKNDYRQFGILKNPLLNKKTSRLRLIKPGATGSFTVGATSYAVQGITGVDGLTSYNRARGTIEYWSPGVSGYTGSAELVVSGVSGSFLQNGVVYATGVSFGIQDVIDNEIAGTESRRMLKLKVASLVGNFAIDGSDFKTGLWVSSVGNPVAKVKNTRFTGSVYRWEPSPTSLSTGYLYVEYPAGRPLISEGIVQTDYYLRPTSSLTGTAKVIEIEEIVEEGKTLYDQTTKLQVSCDVSTPFDSNSFVLDNLVEGISGATSTATGKVLEWAPTSEILGVLTVFDVRGSGFVEGSGITFNYGQSPARATISSIIKIGDLKYKSGELEYIQNMTAISRSSDQREEIKVLFQL
jgi:hypothetical protein